MNVGEVFVRGVWTSVPSEDDLAWVERVASFPAEDSPCGDIGPLVRKMHECGVSSAEIARFAKIIGYLTAFDVCYHLGDPNASYEGFDDDAPKYQWGLFEVEDDKPTQLIGCVHELMLGADPSGREMRPKKSGSGLSS